jgi:hypothetical protein
MASINKYMKFKALIVTNRIKVEYKDDLEKLKKYIEDRTPFEVEFSYETSDLSLEFESFGVRKMLNGNMVDMWGTKGTKDKIRDLNIVPPYLYHVVFFLYDLEETGFLNSGRSIGHWTFYNQIVPGTEFVEVATTRGWDNGGDIFRVLSHEIYHVWHFRARRAGIATEDTMDKYDKEFDVFATDGNRERNLKALTPYWSVIAAQPFFAQYIQALINIIKLLQEKIMELSKSLETEKSKQKRLTLEQFAEAIKQYEGWFVGSCSYRNNNPGNLRYSKYQIGQDDGNFSIFKTYEDGWKALIFQLQISVDGRSKYYRPEMSLIDFFKVYAPSSDNNHPVKYAEFVAQKLGVSAQSTLKELFT